MARNNFDVVIIGSGITGSMIARFLSKYELSVLVIEKEIDVGMCPSSANSAIIHAGHDPEPGTLKAKLNVRGNKLWDEITPELNVAYQKTGSYVVAVGNADLKKLEELYHRGVANGVPQMKILSRDEFLVKEPLIHPGVSGALWTPTAAVIDPFGAVLAAAENAVTNGVEYRFETNCTGIILENGTVKGVKTDKGDIRSERVINCAGLYSDDVMHSAGVRMEFFIKPKKGDYLIFDPSKVILNNVLFHTPNEKGKGILVSTTTHGNVMIGPNSVDTDSKTDTSTSAEGLKEIMDGARKLVPSLNERDAIAIYSGVRARGSNTKDFIIEVPKEIRGFVNLGAIDSPGFASAPAIAEMVIELLKETGLALNEKKDWEPSLKPKPVFHKMSHKEKADLIAKNPAYGRIVCRCEEITEGEVIDAIRSPVPARSYDGVKRRTWLGTGRCQGGFDYPRVIEILSQELGIPASEVTKKGKGSEIVFRGTKDA